MRAANKSGIARAVRCWSQTWLSGSRPGAALPLPDREGAGSRSSSRRERASSRPGASAPDRGSWLGWRSQRSPLARQRVHQRPSDLSQRRWVCPSPIGTRELARSCVEAAELCAGLHRHLGRRSTSTSSRDPRELQSRHRGREAVANAWSTPHLDLVRLENRPAQARGANAQLEPARSRARESACTSSGCAHA